MIAKNMIVDQEIDILKYWEDSGRQLFIKAKAGNDKTSRAKEIMNQMIKEDCSILLLTSYSHSWVFGLDKSPKTLIGPCKYIIDEPDVKRETDLLVFHDSYDIPNDFPIESIKFKYILILSDESGRAPSFFKGKVIRLINWDNINGIAFDDDGTVYRTSSDHEGNIALIKDFNEGKEQELIRFPVEKLKKILLE